MLEAFVMYDPGFNLHIRVILLTFMEIRQVLNIILKKIKIYHKKVFIFAIFVDHSFWFRLPSLCKQIDERIVNATYLCFYMNINI